MAQCVRLQHLVAIPDRAVQRAVIAQGRRGRNGEIRVAVGDRRIVVAENVVLQIRVQITVRGGHRARAWLIQR